MRQVGKKTLLKNISDKKRKYITLDNPKDLLMAKEEPEFFFQTYTPAVFIDEIQYATNLLNYIKMISDNSDKYGIIWLTGSQQFSFMNGVTESLAGRVDILNMYGYSIYERQGIGSIQNPFLPNSMPKSKLKKIRLNELMK